MEVKCCGDGCGRKTCFEGTDGDGLTFDYRAVLYSKVNRILLKSDWEISENNYKCNERTNKHTNKHTVCNNTDNNKPHWVVA